MFFNLKEKLKNVLKKISISIEKEAPETKQEETKEQQKTQPTKKKAKKENISKPTQKPQATQEIVQKEEPKQLEPQPEKKGFFSKIFKQKEEITEEKKEIVLEQEENKKGILSRITEKITTTHISGEQFDHLFNELELVLLENNVALAVVDKIREQLKRDLVGAALKRGKVLDAIKASLHHSIEQLFTNNTFNLIQAITKKNPKPYVIVFVGVNGSGKTTTIAKVASLLKKNHLRCILVAGDTWRAASIQQLEEHGRNLDIKVIKHTYGSDPAAVAFDGIKAAQANKIDVVLIDTAGRQHSNKNLMEEMKKIIRVANPDLKIFIGESITGNDSILQSEAFNEAIGIDGIILTKSDVDEKGGALISISYVTKKPILYLGLGQHYEDLEIFDPEKILKQLDL